MIRCTTLRSGLTVISDSMDGVESVSLGVWVDAGTRDERADINGIAHLLEHMAFKGTKRRTARAIAEEIEAVGGQLNAYTSREQTVYYARVLAEHVPLAIDMLADILQHSTLDSEELERERAVVLQEIGQAQDTPDDIVFDHFQAAAYPGQPMGWPILGSTENVQKLGRDSLFAYLHDHYRPDRMILAAAGQIDHPELEASVIRRFDSLLERTDRTTPEPTRYQGGEAREHRDLEQVHLVIGFEGIAFDDPDFYAQSIFTTLFGGGMSSRLFQEVREKRGLAYSVYAFNNCYMDGGLFGIYAGTGERELSELIPVLAQQMVAVTQDVEQVELDRARAQLKASILMSLESSWARCDRLGQHMSIFGRVIPVEEIVARIEAVDRTVVMRFARRLLASRPTIAAVGPTGGLESYQAIEGQFS